MEHVSEGVTAVLNEIADGREHSLDRLIPLVYDELRQIAARHLRGEPSGHTLQPTALVHEAYIRLARQGKKDWRTRAVFFHVAARMMRRVLVDHARGHHRAKRGGAPVRLSLDDLHLFSEDKTWEVLAVDEALNRLAQIDPRQADVVELRFYGGLSVEEAAKVLDISPKTVKRDWTIAKAWLYGDLKAQPHGIDPGPVGKR
jgi:RNA polymerase sigma factor (TIGR02999 family)